MANTTGYLQEIDTLTQVVQPILKQKFYEIENLPDYVNFDMTGEYMNTLIRGRTRMHSEKGVGFRNGSQGLAKAPSVNVSRDIISINNYAWLERIEWSTFEIEQASRGIISFDVLAEKVESVKKRWDLDKQDAIFAGFTEGNIGIKGLLNIDGVTSDTTIIPSASTIKSLSATQMYNFVATILSEYAKNSKIATMPDRFVVPLDDYLGWGNIFSADNNSGNGFNLNRSIVEYLNEMFKSMTQNPGFKILPTKYAEAETMKNLVGANVNRYVLYKKEDDALKFHIPQELRTTQIVATSGTTFSMDATGQIAGIMCGRPENLLYIDAGV